MVGGTRVEVHWLLPFLCPYNSILRYCRPPELTETSAQSPVVVVTKSCSSLCNAMDCSIPGFPVFHYLPKFAQTHVHWVRVACHLTVSSSAAAFFCLQSFPAVVSFLVSQLFISDSQSIGPSALASVLQWIFRVDFHCIYVLQLLNLFICHWPSRLPPCPLATSS